MMETPEEDGGPLAGRSARLLRQGSSMLVGGAALILPEMPGTGAEAAPVTAEQQPILRRQITRRLQTQEQVSARLAQETWSRFWPWFVLMLFVLIVGSSMLLYYMIEHLIAVNNAWFTPCDQPLKWYAITLFGLDFFNQNVLQPQLSSRFGPAGLVASFVIGLVMSWSCMAWGYWMVEQCTTCQNTSPELYTSARTFIHAQMVFAIVSTICLSIGSVGAIRFLALVESHMHRGCPTAIAKMTKLQPDDEELIDPEDKKVMDCPICRDPLDAQGKTPLRTPCGHHFHMSCLEQWVKSHVDCPMCRATLGDPEEGV